MQKKDASNYIFKEFMRRVILICFRRCVITTSPYLNVRTIEEGLVKVGLAFVDVDR